MYRTIMGQALGKITKFVLAPVGPLAVFLDCPRVTHIHCLEQAYHLLQQDGRHRVASLFESHHAWLIKGCCGPTARGKTSVISIAGRINRAIFAGRGQPRNVSIKFLYNL